MELKSLSRRGFIRVAAGLAAGTLLAACQPKVVEVTKVVTEKQVVKETVIVAGTAQVIEKTVEKVITAPPVKAPVEVMQLQFWSFGVGWPSDKYPHGKREQEWSDEYTKLHPEVKINYQAFGWDAATKVSMSITAGNPPNMQLRTSIGSTIAAIEGQCALEFELPDEFQKDLPKGWYEGMKYQGKNFQVPFYCLANGMILNLSLVKYFKAEDLLPKAPERKWNFDQYLELMKKCSGKNAKGGDVYGAVYQAQQTNPYFYWPEQVQMWGWGADDVVWKGGKWVCRWNDDDVQAYLKWWQELYTVHKVIPNPSGQQKNRWELFDTNQCLSGIGPDIGWSKRTDHSVDPTTLVVKNAKLDIEWIYVRCPSKPPIESGFCWGGAKLDVNSMPFKTKYAKESQPSIDFCLWLSNRENQKWSAQYILPARLSATAGVTDNMLMWHLNNYIPWGRQRAAADGGRAKEACEQLQQVIERLWLGQKPTEAVGDACKVLNGLQWLAG